MPVEMSQSEKILKNLPKYKLYENFDKNEDKDKYSRFCADRNYLNDILTDFYELCLIYARNLVTLPTILKDEIGKNESCRYFTFWIHDKIRKIDPSRWKRSDEIQYILRQFYQVESDIQAGNENNNCFYHFNSNMKLNLWLEWKDLYDYIINYEDIKNKIESDQELCKLYPAYFDNITSIHKKYKAECCNKNYSSLCPDGINFNVWCDKDELFNKLQCDPNKKNPRASIVHSETPNALDRQEIDRTNSKTRLQDQRDYTEHGDILTNNTDYYIKLSVPLLLLGLSSTFFYLYNFTSFGSLVRSKLLGKSKIKDNMNEDAQHLLEYQSDNLGEDLYDNDFHINYYPS
ncbi:PIR Superfamily Protein [Plasmodium ovale wallikeri]|uniref:PIR Superfamily Protein n=1 Tax=Plasmodium ovale wallikeri TaxID=864142 RepID=A0A1A9ARV8_PLAOA|nr:PIR Superfamily Protein [Plasmodium ovale wallikeri]